MEAEYAVLEVVEGGKMAELQDVRCVCAAGDETDVDKATFEMCSEHGGASVAWVDGGASGWRLVVSESPACRVLYPARATFA
jgi:hypothetical protein